MGSKEKHDTERQIGLGCMRLSTAPDRDEARGVAVIHAALDAGATLLDTADAYCHNEKDVGHNERLIAKALETWSSDGSRVRVATKGGLVRPGGAWVPDGRAKHLRAACEASREALGVEAIDLYQLHVVDPRTPFETSVRALAALKEAGKVRAVGLSNVTVAQIEAARRIVDVAAVQISLSVLDSANIRNGVVEFCRDHGIEIIAYRPLGGSRGSVGLAKDPLLAEIGGRVGATAQEIALAWLLELAPKVVPIPGATREPSARSIGRALTVELAEADRARLDDRFFGSILRGSRSLRRMSAGSDGEVVVVMGMPGAGKSTVALELEARGYQRLNRDLRGGSLSSLVRALDEGLAGGSRRWVLDNTYATRASRNEVLECAWKHGVAARCVWVATSLADAQINAISRLLEAHGRLPSPEELRERGKRDPRYFGPDAQFRFERTLELPASDEGFAAIEELRPARGNAQPAERRAVVLEFDGVLVESARSHPAALDPDDVRVPASHVETLARYAAEGWLLFAQAWRPQLSSGETSVAEVEACFARARDLLGLDIEIACCPHPAGPPVCWCRKPIPGLVLEFAMRAGVDPSRSVVVGRAAADRTLADRLGATYLEKGDFYRP